MFALLGYLAGVVVILSSMVLGLARLSILGDGPLPPLKTAALSRVETHKADTIKERIKGAEKALTTVNPVVPVDAEPTQAKPDRKAPATAPADVPVARKAAPATVKAVSLKPKPRQRALQRHIAPDDDYFIEERPYRHEAFGWFRDSDSD